MFGTPLFQLSCSLFTDERRATPVQDTAQWRHRRRRAVGTRCEDSFQIKTLRKHFLLSLVDNIPRFLSLTEEEAGVLAFGHVRILIVPGHQRLLTKGVVQPVSIKTEYLRECSASRVWPYMHQLRVMILVKCWVARLLCSAALRFALSAKAAPGELLRLCPGSARRAPH